MEWTTVPLKIQKSSIYVYKQYSSIHGHANNTDFIYSNRHNHTANPPLTSDRAD